MRSGNQLVDQGAHFLAGFAIVAGAQLLGAAVGPAAGAWIALAAGLVRELTEEGEISPAALWKALGSRRDLTFWTLGGIVGGML